MSIQHPIIAVTGSSGAGTSTTRHAFEHIIRRQDLRVAFVDGDGFHRFERETMHAAEADADARGEALSHFSPSANRLDDLADLFTEYSAHGTGTTRRYLHDQNEAAEFEQMAGTFTPWAPLPIDTNLLMYEGLHGGAVTDSVDIASHVDLLVGVTPTINIEWIQKIHRDMRDRCYAPERSTDIILRRMPDYVETITPQFARSDINFQRVPLVDTSDPFIANDVPGPDESMVVIRFSNPERFSVDFPYLLTMIPGAFMSRPNTLVVPGTKMRMAIEIIIGPIIRMLTAADR